MVTERLNAKASIPTEHLFFWRAFEDINKRAIRVQGIIKNGKV